MLSAIRQLAVISVVFWAIRVALADTSAQALRPNLEKSLSGMIQQIVADCVPRQFVDDRGWGKTAKVINGLKIERDGNSLKLHKHTHEVNDGLWQQYKAELVDPRKELLVRVQNVRSTGPSQTSLELFLAAKLHGEARLEQWKDGVKLLTLTTDADCKIEALVDMDVRVSIQPGAVLGETSVDPKVSSAKLNLVDFQLQKISKLQGWTARQLGDELKPVIEKQLHREEPKLVDKLNAAIQKNKSRLHFSPDAALSGGISKLESLLNFDGDEKPLR